MEDFSKLEDTGYNLRGHRYKLATSRSLLEVRRNFFSQRVVVRWNQMPAHIIEAPTVKGPNNCYEQYDTVTLLHPTSTSSRSTTTKSQCHPVRRCCGAQLVKLRNLQNALRD